jgi:hypothetical protein
MLLKIHLLKISICLILSKFVALIKTIQLNFIVTSHYAIESSELVRFIELNVGALAAVTKEDEENYLNFLTSTIHGFIL